MKKSVVLLLGVSALLAAAGPGPAGEPFRRSRWIAERMDRMLFSGGVLPAGEVPPEAFTVPFAPEEKAARPRHVQVSFDLLAQDGSGFQDETQAEPYLAINPENDNHLVAGYQEGRFATGGARALAFAVSTNGGRSWQEGLVPGLTTASGGTFARVSDPWVAFGPGGRVYYASLVFQELGSPDNGILVSASSDGGLTWDAPVFAHRASGRDFDDKEAIVADARRDSPFRGRVYVGWDTAIDDERQPLRIAVSSDEGRSFGPAVDLWTEGANIGIVPLVGPGGVVHAIWLNAQASGLAILSARSEDGGATWSDPVPVATVSPTDVPGLRVGGSLPAAAIDPRTGALYVAWNDGRFSSRICQVALSRSTDGGRTWSAPQRVSNGPATAPNFTPAVAVGADGVVTVAYYTLRHDPNRRFLVDEYLATSKDGGRRFNRTVRVSAASWDARFAALAGSRFFLGDYQGLAAGRRMAHPLWIATFLPSEIDPPARQPDAFTRGLRP